MEARSKTKSITALTTITSHDDLVHNEPTTIHLAMQSPPHCTTDVNDELTTLVMNHTRGLVPLLGGRVCCKWPARLLSCLVCTSFHLLLHILLVVMIVPYRSLSW